MLSLFVDRSNGKHTTKIEHDLNGLNSKRFSLPAKPALIRLAACKICILSWKRFSGGSQILGLAATNQTPENMGSTPVSWASKIVLLYMDLV
jgi:hypothetical protein